MRTNEGLIKQVLIIVIALIILGYFGFNLESIIKSPTVQANLQYVWHGVLFVWTTYLQTPAMFVWDKIIVGLVWNQLLQPGLHRLGVV